jgi:hypothetical protein
MHECTPDGDLRPPLEVRYILYTVLGGSLRRL